MLVNRVKLTHVNISVGCVKQVGVGQVRVQGWTEEHRQHSDGQSPAGVPQFR